MKVPAPRFLIKLAGGVVFLSFFLATIVWAEDPAKNFAKRLKKRLHTKERVAVSYVYDRETGDISVYGNRWRDRLVSALTERKIKVVPRQDLALLVEDIETFRKGSPEALWRGLEAQVVIVGSYYRKFSKDGYQIEICFKALRTNPKEILLSKTYEKVKLTPGEMRLLTVVRGNIYRRRLKKLGRKPLPLTARLNKTCFLPGEEARLTVETKPGVYLYIFNIAADLSVTRLYPNRFFPERPLPAGRFEFPPKGMKRLSLEIRAYPGLDPAYESFRVVVSRRPLKDEIFPVPENRVLVGGKASNLSELQRLLKSGKVSMVELPYLVGKSCRSGGY